MVVLQNFEIILDNSDNIFWPGDTVTGRVIVQLGRPKSVQALKIRCKGMAKTSWEEKSGMGDSETTWSYGKSEDYYRMEVFPLGGSSGNEMIKMAAGHHTFPFTFTLPHNIPSSFESCHGKVRHMIKATMPRPWKFDHKTEIQLGVQTPFDFSQIPSTLLPIEDEHHKTFGCFPFCESSMFVYINVPVSGFAIGETIEARIALNNHSRSVEATKIKLRLKQNITLYARTNTKTVQQIVQKTEKLEPFDKTNVIMMSMQLSATPPSGLPNCNIIDIDYYLDFEVVVSGMHRNVHVSYPIIIGTKSGMSY